MRWELWGAYFGGDHYKGVTDMRGGGGKDEIYGCNEDMKLIDIERTVRFSDMDLKAVGLLPPSRLFRQLNHSQTQEL